LNLVGGLASRGWKTPVCLVETIARMAFGRQNSFAIGKVTGLAFTACPNLAPILHLPVRTSGPLDEQCNRKSNWPHENEGKDCQRLQILVGHGSRSFVSRFSLRMSLSPSSGYSCSFPLPDLPHHLCYGNPKFVNLQKGLNCAMIRIRVVFIYLAKSSRSA